MVAVVCWCCRRSGPNWFRRSRLLASIDSWFIGLSLQLVDFVIEGSDLLLDVCVVGRQVPRLGETSDLHREPEVEQLREKVSALEHGKDAGSMDIEVVVSRYLREDAYPCIELGQGEFFTGHVDDKLWNFQGTLLSGVGLNIQLHTHKEKPTR